MSKSRTRGLALASFLVLTLFAITSYAQSGSSTVQGTVKDPQGNLVSGASVTLTDPSKNFTRTQQTNADGAYIFTAIPPGTYKLDVSAPGFKTASASGLVALVDTPTMRDVQLEIGSVGGPIKRDRSFFFFTYEGFREATATSVVREVPLPTLAQGIVRYRTESGFSDPGCPPGTQHVLSTTVWSALRVLDYCPVKLQLDAAQFAPATARGRHV